MADLIDRYRATAAIYFGTMLSTEMVRTYCMLPYTERENAEFDIMTWWDHLSLDEVRTIAEVLVHRGLVERLPESTALFTIAHDACEGALNAMGSYKTLLAVELADIEVSKA